MRTAPQDHYIIRNQPASRREIERDGTTVLTRTRWFRTFFDASDYRRAQPWPRDLGPDIVYIPAARISGYLVPCEHGGATWTTTEPADARAVITVAGGRRDLRWIEAQNLGPGLIACYECSEQIGKNHG